MSSVIGCALLVTLKKEMIEDCLAAASCCFSFLTPVHGKQIRRYLHLLVVDRLPPGTNFSSPAREDRVHVIHGDDCLRPRRPEGLGWPRDDVATFTLGQQSERYLSKGAPRLIPPACWDYHLLWG